MAIKTFGIRYEESIPITDADVAIVSIANSGEKGNLNSQALKAFGYSETSLPKSKDLEKGYAFLKENDKKGILFVVTIGSRLTGNNLLLNLENGIKNNAVHLKDKLVWIAPLGTGKGGLSVTASIKIIIQVFDSLDLDKLNLRQLLLSIPGNIRKTLDDEIEPLLYSWQVNYNLYVGNLLKSEIVNLNLTSEKIDNSHFWWINIQKGTDIHHHDEYFTFHLSDQVLGDRLNDGQLAIVMDTSQDIIGLSTISGIKSNNGNYVQSINLNYLFKFGRTPSLNDFESYYELSLLNLSELLRNEVVQFPPSNFFNFLKYTDFPFSTVGGIIVDEGDNIPFHLDQIAVNDRLKRAPVAKRISKSLNNQVFATPLKMFFLWRWLLTFSRWFLKISKRNRGNEIEKRFRAFNWIDKFYQRIVTERANRHAFMIHLQGAWGDGKSTFMRLIRSYLNDGHNKWIVVEFNAWQNQHISPPWWSFLDQVFKKSLGQLPILIRPFFWIREVGRRYVDSKFWKRSITIFVFGVVLFFTYKSVPEVTSYFGQEKTEKTDKGSDSKTKDPGILDLIKILSALSSGIALIYGFSQFLIKPFFLSSPEAAKAFSERVGDPMMKVKKHFESLISNLEVFGYRVAIFIDDVDRCNAEFTVKLLEGIQTLYKDRKVLYIVAGDRHWICNCFETHYEKFSPIVREPGQKLGYLFLEKAFQLSIRLPHITEETKKEYWDFILNPSEKKSSVTEYYKSKKENKGQDSTVKNAFKEKFDKNNYNDPSQYESIQKELGISEEEVTELALESVNDDQEDIKHILQNHHDLIESNPRSIKRLANQYTIYRDILIAERRVFNKDKLFRWVVLQNVYPMYTDYAEFSHDLMIANKSLPEKLNGLNELSNSNHWKKLVVSDEKRGGSLDSFDIETFVGFRKQRNS